jgi:hypothetical protein
LLNDQIAIIARDVEGFGRFNRSGSKEAFRKQLSEEFVRRSGAGSLDEAVATAMTSVLCETLGRALRKCIASPPKPRNPADQILRAEILANAAQANKIKRLLTQADKDP